jgi:metallophosphoesterase (TIGR00282 family)
MKVLLIGDVVGLPGRMMIQKHLPKLQRELEIDATIVNGENSADGKGITPRIMHFFKHNKVDVVTSGNHIWNKKEIYPYIAENKDLLRPANFPSESPGVGVTTVMIKNQLIAVINLQGRVFMRELIDCPFKTAQSILTYLRDKTKLIFVDFHAETTSEKQGLSYFLDGKITGFVGTHTHVQTADERILPQGTAYITDLGMCGALNSMIGMKKEPIIQQYITQMPTRFTVETTGPFVMSGVVIDADPISGKARSIERIRIIDDVLQVETDDNL